NIYDDGLDNFKLAYGVPPSLDVKIADPMLDHFNLLDPDLSALQIRVTDVLNVLREGALTGNPDGAAKQPIVSPATPPPHSALQTNGSDFASLVKRSAELRADAARRFAAALDDLKRLDAAL